jgi:hypothetical protein
MTVGGGGRLDRSGPSRMVNISGGGVGPWAVGVGGPPRGDNGVEVGDELFEVEGGDEDAIGAGGCDVSGLKFFGGGGDEEDGDVGARAGEGAAVGATAEAADDFDGTEVAEGGVDQGEVEGAEAEDFECLDTAGDGTGPESAVDESLGEECAQVGIVGDDEDVRSFQG